jgi:D-alanyl-D-alanine carboxypeptidase/D-alanyl-D-alanine-endopeptidase (penicillin-binding protein 4)
MPLSAASLTKIATSLAALEVLGINHQFVTLIGTTGPIQAGVLQGDLVVQGGGDPLFVWEEAIVLGNTLNSMGIRQVTGDLVIVNKFYMNYESSPMKAGQLLKQALNAKAWSPEVEYQYATLPLGTARPQLTIAGKVRIARSLKVGSDAAQVPTAHRARLLLRHRSLPLRHLLKLMNVHSNNEMAQALADAVGGASVVAQHAAQATGLPQTEIQLLNGSGLGVGNRISPRTVCALLMALQERLQLPLLTRTGGLLTVADTFPIAGKDMDGTIFDRKIPVHAAVKTGTLNTVSALAGVLPTRDRGLVWFAIINQGTNIEGLRAEQDRLLQTLVNQWGTVSTVPPAIAPHSTNDRDYIGNASRNEILVTF